MSIVEADQLPQLRRAQAMKTNDELRLTFKAPASMKQEIEQAAAANDLTVSQFIRLAVREFLAHAKEANS
jgi:uncharacterized protein (DUF1778 family)